MPPPPAGPRPLPGSSTIADITDISYRGLVRPLSRASDICRRTPTPGPFGRPMTPTILPSSHQVYGRPMTPGLPPSHSVYGRPGTPLRRPQNQTVSRMSSLSSTMSMSELTRERSHLSVTELTRERSQKVRERYQRLEEQAARSQRPPMVSNLRSFSYDKPSQHGEMERMLRARSDLPAPAPVSSPMPVAESPQPLLHSRIFAPPARLAPIALSDFGVVQDVVLDNEFSEPQDGFETERTSEVHEIPNKEYVAWQALAQQPEYVQQNDVVHQADRPLQENDSSQEVFPQHDAQQQEVSEQHQAAQQHEHENEREPLPDPASLRVSLCISQTAS